MEQWRKDARHEPIIVDLEALVPKDHLLRKIEKVMDYGWLYERLDPYYCHDNGRPGTDPVVLIKMVLIQHLFGIPSLRQTYREIQVNVAYRWFLGYGLLDNIPHFATVSYAFCKRFPDELTTEIFEHILNKALNNKMLDTSAVFIDSTHIKASANKKKFQKEQVAKAAKVYSGQLRREVNAEREKLGKKPIEDENDNEKDPPQGGGNSQNTVDKTVSITDPDCGMFVKGDHERQFAYEAHTAKDIFVCPHGQQLRHTTTDREGKRAYRSTPKNCVNCPSKAYCGANEKGQKLFTTHIWQEYLDIVESIRKTELGKRIYAQRKETIERVFADAKEKHAMRYTHHRGLAAVTRWVRLKYAAMNLKKLAQWSWKDSIFSLIFVHFPTTCRRTPAFAC